MTKTRVSGQQKTAQPVPKAAHPVSPLAPAKFPTLPPLAGVRLATGEAGVRYKGRTDVLLVTLAPGTQAAGVFTKSKTSSAPVDWCRANLKSGGARALVVNSGNANAFTGKAGMEGAQAVARSASATLGCKASEVMLASTGVIGEPLPAERITKILGKLADEGSAGAWRAAAEAIMTTDTYPKLSTAQAMIDLAHAEGLVVRYIFLTHTHEDHVADLERFARETKAEVWASEQEPAPLAGAKTFAENAHFHLGTLAVKTLLTSGHSPGMTTFFVTGLSWPLAIVGDAIFAASMGGSADHFLEQYQNNRKKIFTLPRDTVLACGHGPLTTLANEKVHNPFFAPQHHR